jgi:methyl coenzyme M reductase beta subunit
VTTGVDFGPRIQIQGTVFSFFSFSIFGAERTGKKKSNYRSAQIIENVEE